MRWATSARSEAIRISTIRPAAWSAGTADVQRTNVQSRQDYAYDSFGNRTAASRTGGSVGCLGGCELSPAIDAATNHITGAQYDAAGNLTFIQDVVGNTTYNANYTYDSAGSLVHAATNNDDRQFIYTADDERIATARGASWTWTVRGLDGKVLREFTSLQPQGGLPTSNRQWAKDYIWRDGLLLASVTATTPGNLTPTTTQHFHLDHLGTPRVVTGDKGVQLGVHSYYPFGAELSLTPNEQPAELMKFTGHERDALGNDPHTLDDMHARYEMGTMGRFLSVDPSIKPGAIQSPQLWNRYSYTANNPMNRVDPDGRNWFDINGTWQWHKGEDYTVNKHTYHSNYTHLLVAQATGTKNGATQFNFTLYNQNKVAMTGTGFSGGAGPRIGAGNYKIRTDIAMRQVRTP